MRSFSVNTIACSVGSVLFLLHSLQPQTTPMADISTSDFSSTKPELPPSVERLLDQICRDQSQSPPGSLARTELASLGEEASLYILRQISKQTIRTTFDRFILFMARKHASTSVLPSFSPPAKSPFSTPPSNRVDNGAPCSPVSHQMESLSLMSEEPTLSEQDLTDQLRALEELEFRKKFITLSYIGSKRLEDLISPEKLHSFRDLGMQEFESQVWELLGRNCIEAEDRRKYKDWNAGSCTYHCHVSEYGSYIFKGPFANKSRNHMQRVLGDENILLVKFADELCSKKSIMDKIFNDGILLGMKCYRFFVFKDKGKEDKKKSSTSSSVCCYFVCLESREYFGCNKPYIASVKTIPQARYLFMHAHTVSSIPKFMARFGLILSKTMKLPVNLDDVHVERIDEILCQKEDGTYVYNDDGEPLIHTDGTGFISEDIAMMCPQDIFKGECVDQSLKEKYAGFYNWEPPLLMQVRLFKNGCAVKGTLLVNKKLPPRTIQIRPSMLKVENDDRLLDTTENSLEIVNTSCKPKKARLSRSLIALLCYGGVPKEFFLEILMNTLAETQSTLLNKRAAFSVSMRNGAMDDFNVVEMILADIPLDEPFLQYHLSILMKEERKNLKGGKLPIDYSYNLMGTADPTGMLKTDEVCIILEDGQLSGKVLVYRHPGCHFGDIHVLTATYIKEMENFVGNAKYAIFFPTKGHRSLADEMAGGDFDGDMFFVSRNPKLLDFFVPSEPWTQMFRVPNAMKKKPSDFSAEDLEYHLYNLFLATRFSPCRAISEAADSCLSFMDRLLVLGDDSADEKAHLKQQMLQLVDIYSEALDAPKSGKKVDVPKELKAKRYPHFMERDKCYRSTSILGEIYDEVDSFDMKKPKQIEIWTLPCFHDEVPENFLELWKKLYDDYRLEMTAALGNHKESKNELANAVIEKYKKILYGSVEYSQRTRKDEDIFNESLAIYQISYAYAKKQGKVSLCSFPWKVAGAALLELYRMKQGDRSFVLTMSVAKELF